MKMKTNAFWKYVIFNNVSHKNMGFASERGILYKEWRDNALVLIMHYIQSYMRSNFLFLMSKPVCGIYAYVYMDTYGPNTAFKRG